MKATEGLRHWVWRSFLSQPARAGLANSVLKRGYLWPSSLYYFTSCMEGYQALDVKDKVVVDIGADWGNSVVFWWLKGAKKVIAYEADRHCYGSLKTLVEQGKVPLDFRGPWHGEYPKGDVLKIDCEGCESWFDLAMLSAYQQWAVALHQSKKVDTYGKGPALEALGGKLVHEQPGERIYVKA